MKKISKNTWTNFAEDNAAAIEAAEAASGRSLSEPATPSGALVVGTGSAIPPPHFATPEEIIRTLDRECQRLQAENAKLREVRDAVLDYERISDTEYALGPFVGDEHLTPGFRRLLRALHATMPNARDVPTREERAANPSK